VDDGLLYQVAYKKAHHEHGGDRYEPTRDKELGGE
jgi:hypothetical protein